MLKCPETSFENGQQRKRNQDHQNMLALLKRRHLNAWLRKDYAKHSHGHAALDLDLVTIMVVNKNNIRSLPLNEAGSFFDKNILCSAQYWACPKQIIMIFHDYLIVT